MMTRLALLILLSIFCMSCTGKKESAKQDSASARRGRSAGEAVVDIVTRRDAVEAGKKAKATIDAVQARRQEDFEEALGGSQ